MWLILHVYNLKNFLGNDLIHLLTTSNNYSLYIRMKTTDGNTYWAEYDSFSVTSGADGYRLHLGHISRTYSSNVHANFGKLMFLKIFNIVPTTLNIIVIFIILRKMGCQQFAHYIYLKCLEMGFFAIINYYLVLKILSILALKFLYTHYIYIYTELSFPRRSIQSKTGHNHPALLRQFWRIILLLTIYSRLLDLYSVSILLIFCCVNSSHVLYKTRSEETKE